MWPSTIRHCGELAEPVKVSLAKMMKRVGLLRFLYMYVFRTMAVLSRFIVHDDFVAEVAIRAGSILGRKRWMDGQLVGDTNAGGTLMMTRRGVFRALHRQRGNAHRPDFP